MLDKTKQIWFIGIKGTGMASLALILHDLGYKVAGSDIDKYTFTQDPLEAAGIEVASFSKDNIKESGRSGSLGGWRRQAPGLAEGGGGQYRPGSSH